MPSRPVRSQGLSLGLACLVAGVSLLLPAPPTSAETPSDAPRSVAGAPANLRRPDIIMVDPGAEALRPMIEQIVNEEFDLANREFDWWPENEFAVYVATEESTAIAMYREQSARTLAPVERAELVAKQGRAQAHSLITNGRIAYQVMLFALQNVSRRHPDSIRPDIVHEFTHFAQRGHNPISSDRPAFPTWFNEGQATVREQPVSKTRNLLLIARQDLMPGRIESLRGLSTNTDWFRRESEGAEATVYARAMAAVQFLVERHGWDSTVKLVLAHSRDLDEFYGNLRGLTGTDLDGFEAQLNDWLVSLPYIDAGDPVSGTRVRLIRFNAGRSVQLQLGQTLDNSCGELPPSTLPDGVRTAAFNATADTDGGFAVIRPTTNFQGSPAVRVSTGGRVSGPTDVVGWYRYQNPESGCDLGPMPYGTGAIRTFDAAPATSGLGVTYVARGGQAGASFGLRTAADLFCGALPVVPNGSRLLEGYVVVPGSDGSFQTSGPLAEGSPATVTISGKLVGATDLTGTFQYKNAQTGCDSGPVPFGTIATSEPASPTVPAEPTDEEGS